MGDSTVTVAACVSVAVWRNGRTTHGNGGNFGWLCLIVTAICVKFGCTVALGGQQPLTILCRFTLPQTWRWKPATCVQRASTATRSWVQGTATLYGQADNEHAAGQP